MRIYTTDIDTKNLAEVTDELLHKPLSDKRKIEFEERNKIWEIQFKRKLQSSYSVIRSDADWVELRQSFSHDYSLHFREFYSLYLKGKWNRALGMFEKLQSVRFNDGPTLALRKYMLEHKGGKVPSDWHGYRNKWDF